MKKDIKEKILAGAMFGAMFLPTVSLAVYKSQHDCNYDECMRIFYNGRFGACIEDAINNVSLAITILWYPVIIVSSSVLQNNKNAIFPFFVMALAIVLSIGISLVDPAKWPFVLYLVVSFVIFSIAVACNNKNVNSDKGQ